MIRTPSRSRNADRPWRQTCDRDAAPSRGLAAGTLSLSLALALSACGGGGDGGTPPVGPTTAERVAAATATAQSRSNPCAADAPFYWEVGDATAAMASGSVTSPTDATVYTAATSMAIASASKWLYAAYVVQKQNAVLSDSDINYLTFRSGYTSFSACTAAQTVAGCVDFLKNGVHTPANDGVFYYGGGHMQKHASLIGLGPDDSAALAADIASQLGSDVPLAYAQPQLAGGVVSSADAYARYLRKLLGGQLRMAALLGSHAVCTNPATCTAAGSTPVPAKESWHYSLGHWVEDDPAVGDGAFSSAGAFGFYPWVDAGRRWYGIVARHVVSDGEGFDSASCGRLIRKAWVTAVAQ